jgi:hypothetical protein
MAEVEEQSLLAGAVAEFERQWEFDAPRFRDFEQGTPSGETVDDWFETEATRGNNEEDFTVVFNPSEC